MQSGKTIFVTGATGRQGSATVEALVKNDFHVLALTRDTNSAAAQRLQKLGATLITGNLDDTSSYAKQLQGVYGVCCILTYEHGIKKEILQGIGLADVAKQNNIGHFVYSSVIACDLNTGIPHWESKALIEEHIKKTGLPYTIIRPASLLENFLIPQVKGRILKGNLPSPVNKNVMQQFIACKDVGSIIAAIFADPAKYLGKTFNIAADEMNMEKMATVFSEQMGRPIKYQKMPGIITRLVMGRNLYRMFRWINEHDAVFVKDLPAFQKEHPGLMACHDWIKANFTPAV
jgi:uncharacterized protein YbjT (DUF2867 family)